MATDAALRCPTCGADNASAARYCNQCSAPLEPGRPAVATAAERKQVTVLFSDVTGYTALAERLDPEDTRRIMGRIFGCASEIVARYEGRIEKFIGDAIMAIFGVPLAHEDDPIRALRAALELHDAIARLSPEVEARGGVPIALHSGVNTGVVVTGELQFDHGTAGPLGDTINLAARLMNAAPSGEVWVGPETRHLAERAFEFDDLGSRDFKGKAQPVPVARLRRARARSDGAGGSHFRGAFVGRHAELGALLGAAERVRDGQPQAFGVRGDAGTGKTRLMSELRAHIGADVQWLEGRAYPYAQNIPYAPLIDLLSRVWGIEETDSPAQVRAKLAAGVSSLLDGAGDTLPLLRHLYHLEQDEGVVIEREAYRERLLGALRALLAALARRAPTVLCVQDLHWVDQSTQSLLAGLIVDPPGAVLLVGNFRPGYEAPPGMHVIDLSELSPRQTGDLLASLLQAQPPEPLTRFIAERSDGNPFYVEEVVNSLVETGFLVRAPEGWQLTRSLAEVGVPPTVRGVIAARIDRLDDVRRRVLRHAAVVGREFLYAIVARVCEDVPEVAPSLAQLQAFDLIRARRVEPDLEYIFKHALTQDVAYEGLLKAERQLLHARTARVMEAVFADRIPEFVETLAYHYSRGGVVDKAVQYLVEAGAKCVERYALAEAEAHFRAAYALTSTSAEVQQRSRTLTHLLNAWSHVHYYAGTIGEWRQLLEKHLPDAERCGDPATLSMYLGWLGNVRAFNGDFRASLDSLDRGLEVGTAAQAREALAYVTGWRSFTLFELGRLAEAIRSAESLDQTEAERRRAPYPFVKNQCALALALAISGAFRRAREIAQRVLEFGRASGNASAEAFGHYVLAAHWMLVLDYERAESSARAGAAAAKDPLFRAGTNGYRAVALLAGMQVGPALELCSEWLPYLERNANRWFTLQVAPVRYAAEVASGQLSAGMQRLLTCLRDAQATGSVSSGSLIEFNLLSTYVSIARLDVKPPLGVLLRNPWFVTTQAPFAARKARALIDRLRAAYTAAGAHGALNTVDLCEARLQARRRDKVGARAILDRLAARLRDEGIDPLPPAVRAVEVEIEALR